MKKLCEFLEQNGYDCFWATGDGLAKGYKKVVTDSWGDEALISCTVESEDGNVTWHHSVNLFSGAFNAVGTKFHESFANTRTFTQSERRARIIALSSFGD
jgi:hypothetical protein